MWWGFSFLVFCFCSFAGATSKIVVNDTTTSLFFGTHTADPSFNYGKWAKGKPIYLAPFNQADWDNEAAIPSIPSNDTFTLRREYAEDLLLRFQKPGGFATENTPILGAIINSKILTDSPTLIEGALQNVVSVSPASYESLVSENPILKTALLSMSKKNPLRTDDEEKKIFAAAVEYLEDLEDRLITATSDGTVVQDWAGLMPLSSLLAAIPTSDRFSHEDQIMESIMALAQANEFKINQSSFLFPVVEPAIENLFGDSPEVETMLEMARIGDTFHPRIHGTAPIEGLAEIKNRYGFYSAELETFDLKDVPANGVKKFIWEMAGHRFDAKVKIQRTDNPESLLPKGSVPQYDKMIQENSLTALVVFGTNIKFELHESLDEYIAYLDQKGFKKTGTETSSDFKFWLQDQFESGEITYFDKEAHASSDVDNFLEVDEKAEVVTYRKEITGQPARVVKIAYPNDEESDSVNISNVEWGKWIRKREKKNGIPLLFANLSCWSVDQAKLQVPETHSPLVAEIVSTTTVDEFANEEGSRVRILLEGFFNRKTYPEMREMLKADSGYVNGSSDVFVFPDEEAYSTLLFQGGTPVRIRWRIKDLTSGLIYDGEDLAAE